MLRIYVDAATKGNPGESGGGIVYLTDQSRQQLHVPLGFSFINLIIKHVEQKFQVIFAPRLKTDKRFCLDFFL